MLVGGASERVGTAEGEQECAALVKKMKPDALGANFFLSTVHDENHCWASYGFKVDSDTKDVGRSCVFSTGRIIIVTEILLALVINQCYEQM